jgi:hypothetical protein
MQANEIVIFINGFVRELGTSVVGYSMALWIKGFYKMACEIAIT